MVRRANIFLGFFGVVSVVELLALSRDWQLVHEIAKPLIMLSLIGYYLSCVPQRNNTFVKAMFFCWTGDVLLMFQVEDEMFFMLGLAAFLLGHVLYIVSYRQLRWRVATKELLPTQKIRFIFPIVLAGTGLLVVLFPTLGPLTIPVIIYSVVLMLMVINALFRYGRTTPDSLWLVVAGALLFLVSDSILALNKFYSPIDYSGPLIMLTYILGQYLIVEGVRRHGELVEGRNLKLQVV